METERLRQFCVIADCGSLTKASEVLNISLGGLSKSIKVLEEELGFSLFIPMGRGLAISDKGIAIYNKARSILESIDHLKAQNLEDKPMFGIAALEVFTINLLGKVVAKNFSELSIKILEASPGELETLVINRVVDCGLTYLPHPRSEVEILKIGSFNLLPYARNTKTIKNICRFPFIVPASGLDSNPLGIKERDGWPIDSISRMHSHKVNMLSTAMSLAGEGLGAIFMPDFVAKFHNESHQKEFHLYPLEDSSKIIKQRRDIFLVKRLGAPETSEIKKLVASVKTLIKA